MQMQMQMQMQNAKFVLQIQIQIQSTFAQSKLFPRWLKASFSSVSGMVGAKIEN